MKKEAFCEVLGDINESYVEETRMYKARGKKFVRVKWGVMAACLLLAIVGAVHMFVPDNEDRAVLKWSEGFHAADYFKYNKDADDAVTSDSITASAIPYATSRYFSDDRAQMEVNAVIPAMPNHPLYSCVVHYNEDGSIFSVTFSWHQRGDNYSDLSITAGYQEVERIQDCILVELDEDGNIIPPAVTVTERDGIQIVAEGNENRDKTITFQNDTAWYQISGSWGDSSEAMAELLDWVWEHPIEFEIFSMDKGDEITYSNLDENPEAFAAYIPDFETFGYVRGEYFLSMKNGEAYRFEGHYYIGVDEALIKDGSYLFEDGWTEIHWCIDRDPDYYDLQECLGDISELTEQLIIDTLSEESNFSFMIDDCFIKVYTKEAHAAWSLVESLING